MTHDAIVVGGNVAGFTTLDGELIGAVFDDATDTWTLTTDVDTRQTRILLDCAPPLVPWIPNLLGSNDFQGQSFHAAAIDPGFDPAAQRIAVLGADSASGRLIGKLTRSGVAVKVFPLPPRQLVRPSWRTRRHLRRQPELVTVQIEAVTASGIRTADGSRHDVDTIIFGTGFAVSAARPTLVGTGGHTLTQAWLNGAEPYFGVAVHGFPNYFMLGDTDPEATRRYVSECLQLMAGYTRIEVRRSSQQVFNERAHLYPPPSHPVASAFDLSSSFDEPGDIYDGAATLTLAGTCQRVRVRLAGHVDPIDGQYHWQGTIFDQLPKELVKQARTVSLAVGERDTPARITEETPQGTYSIAGVGSPPFALADIEGVPRA